MKTLLGHAMLALFLAAGCASAADTASSRQSIKTITDRDNGTTLTLHVGDHLKLILGSTYWTIQPSSDTAVLRSDGTPVTKAKMQGCVPGGGCGTETGTFTAVKGGTATIVASRTSCGEALRCTGGHGEYRASVVVK